MFTITCLLWATILSPVQAAPPAGWSGDNSLGFLLEVNGINAADSDLANPIPLLDLSADLTLELNISTGNSLYLRSGQFTMVYLGFPIINQPFDLSAVPLLPDNHNETLLDTSIPLGSLLGFGNLSLISGTIIGTFSFTYANETTPTVNGTVTEDFVLQIGATGPAAIMSISGLITVGFTVMSGFSLLMAFDEFQQGIVAGSKMRKGKRASDVGIFPRAVVLRRKPKKGGETIDSEELRRRVSKAASNSWDGKRCPKCGKKWKKNAPNCGKCGIDTGGAIQFLSDDIADYAPKAMKVVRPKSKVTVGQLGKKLRLKPDKAGALAAALVDMGALQTKTVKIPLKKVAFSGMTIAGAYWSFMQMFSGATPDWVIVFLSAVVGLVVSVFVGYFMAWLARFDPMGYD
jgi:hypothetical protein